MDLDLDSELSVTDRVWSAHDMRREREKTAAKKNSDKYAQVKP